MPLQVWLPLTGDLHNQGTSNISAAGTNISVNTAGKIGSCYSFDGSSSYIELSSALCSNETTEFSYTCWVKFNSTTTCCLFSNRTTTNSNGITLFVNSSGNILYDIGNARRTKAYSFSTGVWYHLTFTYKKGVAKKIYVNGVEIDSVSTTGTMTGAAAEKAFIGASQNTSTTVNTNYLNGYLNDVRIWNDHCLSAAEVHEIAQGLVLHYKLDNNGHQNLFKTDPTVTATVTASGTSAYTAYVPIKEYIKENNIFKEGTPYVVEYDYVVNNANGSNAYVYSQLNYTRSVNSISQTMIRTAGATGHIIENFKVSEGQANSTDTFGMRWRINGAAGGESITISNMRIYLGTSDEINYVNDNSGYGHHGTISETLMSSDDTPRYSSATTSSVASKILNTDSTIPTVLTTNNKYTMCLWLKTSATNNRWIYSIGNGSGTQRGLWVTPNSSKPQFAYSGSGAFTGTTIINDNKWHHIVFTVDGATSKCFVDGVQCGSSTSTKTDVVGSNNVQIFFNGSDVISDFRLYATTLSADDILSLYHTSGKVDNLGRIHMFEINENNVNKLTKTGILHDNMAESIMTLSDGSCWQLLLFHYVDGGNNLFTEDNAAYCNEFGLFSRLRDIDNFKYTSTTYEFYAIQDDIEYRWTQTNAPTASAIAGLTTVSGYTNPVNGIAKATNNSYSYLGYGTWWGACGAWSSYTAGGKTGIPSFGAHNGNGICTRYLALYARIPRTSAKLANEAANASEFIEL